ncbi:hypothetical protein Ancab_008483 [Ancistrocladus abbreviatus]
MEQSISSLTFTGSIPGAIIESKRMKKLFVVYISAENLESVQLEKSTWTDSNVADCVAKYCVLLHISEGSADAAYFSAIYSQKSAPCITVIGYNGTQIWQSEGFISGENLVSGIQKAWLSLHMQDTAATVLTAALASRKGDSSYNESSLATSHEQGDSSSSNVLIHLKECDTSSEAAMPVPSQTVDENKGYENAEDMNAQPNGEVPIGASDQNELKSNHDTNSVPLSETIKKVNDSVPVDDPCSDKTCGSSTVRNEGPTAESLFVRDKHSGVSEGISQLMSQDVKGGHVAVEQKDSGLGLSDTIATELYLNIRLPDGASLQEKFPKTGSLLLVKDYVDKNLKDGYGSYELAIPYPRKVFKDQVPKKYIIDTSTGNCSFGAIDSPYFSKSLLELGLSNRQALIVVPHQRAVYQSESRFSSRALTSTADTSKEREGGYFEYVKKFLSFINPLSYLGGASSSSSGQEAQSNIWQYSPDPAIQNNLRGHDGRSSTGPGTSAMGRDDANRRQRSTPRFGSNIHTLKHDEDDAPFGDANAFWNGNSTQYGGNNDNR